MEFLLLGWRIFDIGYWASRMDAIEYALLFVGVKYAWAGESVEEGYDCSGFIQEVLAGQGIDPKGDQTAQQLYDIFRKNTPYNIRSPRRNYLLFFGKSKTQISHIAMAIDEKQMIEAGGEGRTPTSNGMIRIRPINNRSDLVSIIQVL